MLALVLVLTFTFNFCVEVHSCYGGVLNVSPSTGFSTFGVVAMTAGRKQTSHARFMEPRGWYRQSAVRQVPEGYGRKARSVHILDLFLLFLMFSICLIRVSFLMNLHLPPKVWPCRIGPFAASVQKPCRLNSFRCCDINTQSFFRCRWCQNTYAQPSVFSSQEEQELCECRQGG